MSQAFLRMLGWSAGIHLAVLGSLGYHGMLATRPAVDVVRGEESLEIIVVDYPRSAADGPQPMAVRPVASSPASVEGAFARWAPWPVQQAAPRYPWRARLNGWEGTVVIQAWVDPEGHPASLIVHRSSGYGALDDAAMEAIRRWRFVPAQREGCAVASRVEIPVTFRLAHHGQGRQHAEDDDVDGDVWPDRGAVSSSRWGGAHPGSHSVR